MYVIELSKGKFFKEYGWLGNAITTDIKLATTFKTKSLAKEMMGLHKLSHTWLRPSIKAVQNV
jgi:hypothetical protein